MEALDLDVNNYSIDDIDRFFQYPSPTASAIELRETEIRNQLLNSGHVNPRMQRDLIEFMQAAKTRLIDAKCVPAVAPTTIPRMTQKGAHLSGKTHALDELQYPNPNGSGTSDNGSLGREQNLVVRPTTSFVYTQDSEYFPGTINPLNTRIMTRTLNIDTRLSSSSAKTGNTELQIQLPVKLSKVVEMELASIDLPPSIYQFSSNLGNNYMNFTVIYLNEGYDDSEHLEKTKTIVIPDGNYTSTELVSAINQRLSPRNLDNSLVDPTDHFSYIDLSFNTQTNRVTITRGNLPSGKLLELIIDQTKNASGESVKCTDFTYKLGYQLGFREAYYRGSVQYTGESVVDINPIKYVYLIVDDFQHSTNNQFIHAFNASTMSPHILARINLPPPQSTTCWTVQCTQTITQPRKYFGPVDLSRLKISLIDHLGRNLSLNGSHYSLCIHFKLLYDL